MYKQLTGLLWLSLAGLLLLSSCRKPTEIGPDLLPPEDQLNVIKTDTFSIYAEVVLEDSLETFASANFAVGSKDDPLFGKTKASLYLQPTLITNNLDLQGGSDSFHFDSLVLQLVYADFYGDSNTTQTWDVLQMDPGAEFFDDSIYMSDDVFPTSANLISKSFNPHPNKRVGLQHGDTLLAHLRFKLDDVFGDALMRSDPNTDFANNDAFIDAYPGFLIEPNTGGGHAQGIANLDVYHSQSKMVLYYRLDGDTSSRTYDFPLSTESAYANHFEHDYVGSEVEFLIDGDTDQVNNYMSGLAGVKTRLTIPGLSNLDSITINQAQLEMSIIDDGITSLLYPAPAQILLVKIDSNGSNFFSGTTSISLPEQIVFGATFYGGQLNDDGSPATYTFNIPLYTQDIINGEEENTGLYLITFPNFRRADRVKIGGPNHPTNPLKLSLIYTKND